MEIDEYNSPGLEEVFKKKIHIEFLLDFLKHMIYAGKGNQSSEESCLRNYCKWLVEQASCFYKVNDYNYILPSPDDLFFSSVALSDFESFFYHMRKEPEESISHNEFDCEDFTQTAHASVTHFFAEELRKKIVRKAIRELQKEKKSLLSGDDSGLLNVWDEICVQVQYEYSFYWDIYEDYMAQTVTSLAEKLSWYEIVAIAVNSKSIWDDAINSISNLNESFTYAMSPNKFQKEFPVSFFIDIVVAQVTEDLLCEAGHYNNSRIEKFLYG